MSDLEHVQTNTENATLFIRLDILATLKRMKPKQFYAMHFHVFLMRNFCQGFGGNVAFSTLSGIYNGISSLELMHRKYLFFIFFSDSPGGINTKGL